MVLREQLQLLGVWQGFLASLSVWDVLERVAKRGLLVDVEAQAELRVKLEGRQAEIYEELQGRIPLECRTLHPRKGGRTVGYKKVPAGVKEALGGNEPVVGDNVAGHILVEVEDDSE